MARRSAVHDIIASRKAPKPEGPCVHAVRVEQPGQMLFVSGQLPVELPGGKVFNGPVKRQAELALTHVRNIIGDAGFSMDEVVRTTIYLTDLKGLDKVDEVYRKMFVGLNLPARSVVQVAGLPHDVAVQVDAVAVKRGKSPEELLGDDGHDAGG